MEVRNKRCKVTVNGKKYTIIRVLGEFMNSVMYVVLENSNMYMMKEYQKSEDYVREMSNFHKLEKLGVFVPPLITSDDDNHIFVRDYVSGVYASELIVKGTLPCTILNKVRDAAMRVEQAGMCLDYFPTNFIVSKNKIWYISSELYEKNEDNSFEKSSMKYWLNSAELISLRIK